MSAKRFGFLLLSLLVAGAFGCDGDSSAPVDLGVKKDGLFPNRDRGPDKGLPKKDKGPVKKDGAITPDAPPKPDAGAPDMAQPDAMQPDMMQPDMMMPDMMQPDMMQPDMMMPDMMQPDMLQPDMPIPPLTCTITSPSRAAMLTGSPTVTVKGKVSPMSSFQELTVNGKKITPSPSGDYAVTLNANWGLNIISMECTDRAARIENVVQSFHYSTKYWGMGSTNPTSFDVEKGALAKLYQKALDDGNRSTINDLATIMEKVINGTNLDAQIPSTLVSGSVGSGIFKITYKVTKNGKLSVSPFKIALKARTGGIRLTGSTSSISLPVRAKASIASASGTVKITGLSLTADINVSKSSGGAVSVSVPYIKMNYSKLTVSFSGLGSVLNPIVNGLTSLFKNTIIKRFESEIKKQIPGPVKSFITGFTLAQSFSLPSQLGGKTLKIYSDLDTITFDNYGGLLALNAAIYGTKGITDGKRGSIALSGSYTPPTAASRAMEVAMRQDTLNQVLCAAWYVGALKADLSSLIVPLIKPGSLPITFNNIKFTVEAMLPPILMPTNKSGFNYDIGIGDLLVKLDAQIPGTGGAAPTTVSAHAYVSATMAAAVSFTSKNEIELKLNNSLDIFEIQVTKLSLMGSSVTSLGIISKAIKELVKLALPKMVSPIVQSFPIPEIDLSSLGGSYGIPKGTKLKISNVSLSVKNSHVVMAGDLK